MAKSKKKAAKKKAAKKKSAKGMSKGELINELVDGLNEIGEGTAMTLGSDNVLIRIKGVISTQSAELDKAIGRGGIPLGRLTAIHGPEQSGKTTMALHIVAECQQRGGIVLYIDAEHKLDPDYARAIGVDIDNLIICQPRHLEKGYEVIESAMEIARRWREASGVDVPVLIVLDSINALRAKAEIEGAMEDKHIAPQSRVHSDKLPIIIPELAQENVGLFYIAQQRTNIGKMYGDPIEIACGKAVKFYASLILQVRNKGAVKDSSDEKVAQKTEVECVKNQISPPFKKAHFQIRHGVGIDRLGGLLDQAIDLGVVTFTKSKKTGKPTSWHVFRGTRFANGRGQAWDEMNNDPDLMSDIMLDVGKAVAELKAAEPAKKPKKKPKDKKKKAKKAKKNEAPEEAEAA